MSETPRLEVRYTSEELAVIAALFDVPGLPGCPEIELTTELRSLATRCLVARNVVTMPPDGGIAITFPHTALLGQLLGSPEVIQVIDVAGERVVGTWCGGDDASVHVFHEDGVVTVQAFEGVPTVERAVAHARERLALAESTELHVSTVDRSTETLVSQLQRMA
jgi:hypothetical protein